MMLDGAVELPLSFPAVNKKTNEDEVASRAKSKSLITKASKIVHFSTLWCFLEQVCNGGINNTLERGVTRPSQKTEIIKFCAVPRQTNPQET